MIQLGDGAERAIDIPDVLWAMEISHLFHNDAVAIEKNRGA